MTERGETRKQELKSVETSLQRISQGLNPAGEGGVNLRETLRLMNEYKVSYYALWFAERGILVVIETTKPNED